MPCSSEITSQNWKSKIINERIRRKIKNFCFWWGSYLSADLVTALAGLKMNNFTHLWKFLANVVGSTFPVSLSLQYVAPGDCGAVYIQRLIYSILSLPTKGPPPYTVKASWRHLWQALYVLDCLLVIMAKRDTWKPLFKNKTPWGLNQWKLPWGYMWYLSKAKCKFVSGAFDNIFRKQTPKKTLS